MTKKLLYSLILVVLCVACGKNENPKVGSGGDFFPKPPNGENKSDDIAVVHNKNVQLKYNNSFGAVNKTAFTGSDVLAPSCFINKPGTPGQVSQKFIVDIKNKVSLLQLTTAEDISGAGAMIYRNFYDVIDKAQKTGSFESDEAANSIFKNVTVKLKIAGPSAEYVSEKCTLQAQELVAIEEGPDEGPQIIYALTYRAFCKKMTAASAGQSLTEVSADFTCLVTPTP